MKAALVIVFVLALADSAFCKKKGKGNKTDPQPEAVTPPTPKDGGDANPSATDEASPHTAPPAPLVGDLTTLGGKTYEGVALKRVDPDGLLIVHKDGVTKVLFIDLPEEMRARYGYDSKKAAAFQDDQKAAQAEQAKRQAKERAAEVEKKSEKNMKAKQHSKFYLEEFVVNQVVNSHEFLVHVRHEPDAIRWLVTKKPLNLADNQVIGLRVASTGNTRQYTTVLGARKTVLEVAEEGADVKKD